MLIQHHQSHNYWIVDEHELPCGHYSSIFGHLHAVDQPIRSLNELPLAIESPDSAGTCDGFLELRVNG